MNDFKKNNRFSGGSDRGYKGGGGKSFGGPKEMFQAVCATCGKTCEVPFRPNGKKPVYCKDCFALNGGPSNDSRPSGNFPPRRDFDRPAYKPEYRPEHKPDNNGAMNELKKQMELMNSKLDKLVQILSEKAAPKQADAVVAPRASVEKKPAKKKPAAKKKK